MASPVALGSPAAPSREQEMLQAVVDDRKNTLEQAGRDPMAQSWLREQLDSSEGTHQVYGIMQHQAEQPEFLQKLTDAQAAARVVCAHKHHGNEVVQESWWRVPSEVQTPKGGVELAGSGTDAGLEDFTEVEKPSQAAPESLHSYVLVERQDVLDAIGTFVAAYLATIPQAQDMPPKELQAAVARAFRDLGKSRIRRLWEWGHCIYRCIAFSYGAFSVYENPWLVRAVLMALWTASRILIRGVIPLIL